mmetsp:Transcript_43718/g.56065  ORF Transcript_43718/g.56065 Transcript_43718/m.56065 type:complete len:226 (+) Transcript_43718:198-875(+)
MASQTQSTSILFAGQGTDISKSVARLISGPSSEKVLDYFSRASVVLGYDLLQICQHQKEKLTTTMYSQPAIFVTSLAIAFTSGSIEKSPTTSDFMTSVVSVAGFSLGEYAALVYADALTFEDGVRLVKLRGEAMQTSADETLGSMITVIGLDDDKLNQLCLDAMAQVPSPSPSYSPNTISIANHLFPKGRVLSGHKSLVKWVSENATKPKYGAMMASELKKRRDG